MSTGTNIDVTKLMNRPAMKWVKLYTGLQSLVSPRTATVEVP